MAGFAGPNLLPWVFWAGLLDQGFLASFASLVLLCQICWARFVSLVLRLVLLIGVCLVGCAQERLLGLICWDGFAG